jgi:drug/metabolite transporter (DMT)-like permease
MLIPVIYCIYKVYESNIIDEQEKLYEHLTNITPLTKGILFIVLAAITESLLYIFIKTTDLGNNPWNSVLVTYGLAAIIYGVYYIYENWNKIGEKLKEKKNEILFVILVNMFIASFGYGFRFLSIPNVDAVIHSVISYTGIGMSIIYNLIFNVEKMTSHKIGYLLGLISSLIIFQKI